MKEYLSPSEPHFDDERTMRSAQPVVPLQKINAKARHRRQWFLGGAFALAMMLGAASALLASYLRLRNVPAATAEVSDESDVAPAPLALAASEPSASPEDENIDLNSTPEETAATVALKKEPVVKHRAVVVKRAPESVEPSPHTGTEDQDLRQIRQAVLVDEWQERRARRVERRERRRQEHYNHRDLSNLDEIFEGRRRPN